ncbi:MAG: response regulator transcription factor [Candidatus Hydrogenedentes bacterium]|nr:response regulator transcription factor [Candidatus Hydrogenedentota bacterium]
MRILITDDLEISRTILKHALASLNCEVLQACDGEEAWGLIQGEDAPMLLLLDWIMPGLSGVDLCRRIRAQYDNNLPYIILLSAMNEKANIVEGLNAGANDYLTKPFNTAELLARVKVGIRVVRLQVQLSERIRELEGARRQISDLARLLPVCMYCHKVNPEQESWSDLAQYVEAHIDVEVSHVICPDCRAAHFPELQ